MVNSIYNKIQEKYFCKYRGAIVGIYDNVEEASEAAIDTYRYSKDRRYQIINIYKSFWTCTGQYLFRGKLEFVSSFNAKSRLLRRLICLID